jgi:hypothetical protein
MTKPMKNYLVKVKVDDPYPKEFQKRIEASNAGLASYRAFKKVRKEELQRKQIRVWNFNVITL